MNSRPFLPATACLLGAAGVIAAATAAHGGGDTRLSAAAQILLTHAPAVLALSLARGAAQTSRLMTLAGWAMVAGAVLFSADMAVRHFGGNALFPMAAPVGGLILIGAWLVAALAFLLPRA